MFEDLFGEFMGGQGRGRGGRGRSGAARGSARHESAGRYGRGVLCVEDDGPVIDEDRSADMLEPFTRGDASRNRSTGGSGLGLTLARAIADAHQGSLTLANRKEDGVVKGLVAQLRIPTG